MGVFQCDGILFIAVAALIGCCCSINSFCRSAGRGETVLYHRTDVFLNLFMGHICSRKICQWTEQMSIRVNLLIFLFMYVSDAD